MSVLPNNRTEKELETRMLRNRGNGSAVLDAEIEYTYIDPEDLRTIKRFYGYSDEDMGRYIMSESADHITREAAWINELPFETAAQASEESRMMAEANTWGCY